MDEARYASTYSQHALMSRLEARRSIHNDMSYPSGVQIELTSFCNATCFFCAHTWSKRPQQHFSPDLFKKVTDEVRTWPYPLCIFYLTGLGEPLMHPDWRELFQYANGLPGAFTTNCSVIKKDSDVDLLLSLNFYEIAFSLDTLDPERHKSIRGFGVDRVAPLIEKVFTRARELGTRMRLIVSTTLTHE